MAAEQLSDKQNAPDAMPTILVVEDEVLVRLVIADYLRDCGYKVIEAGNAGEAVTVLPAGTHVDVVFSDIQMPGAMDGFGLAKWVRSHHSGVKVILTSGYPRSADIAGDLCEEGPLVSKPYSPELVVERIRELLAAASDDSAS